MKSAAARSVDAPKPKPRPTVGTVGGLKGWVPQGDRKDLSRLAPYLQHALTRGECLCEENSCKRGLRFLADGRLQQLPVIWEQIPWTCTLAADCGTCQRV
jgi:hypothetical protein